MSSRLNSDVFWGILWRSDNSLDGKREYLIYDRERGVGPALFRTRREARAYRDERFGYIGKRKDLKREPHGWKLPRVVQLGIFYDLSYAGV